MSRSLSVVADNDLKTAAPAGETVAQRVRRLQAEARDLARSHVLEMMAQVSAGTAMALEVSQGGDAYPAGVRDLARKIAEDGEGLIQSLAAILGRS